MHYGSPESRLARQRQKRSARQANHSAGQNGANHMSPVHRRLERSDSYSSALDRGLPATQNFFAGDTPISDIAMLGTHDAGTSNIRNLKGISVCQDLNLIEQAEQGIQYFDLRVRTNSNGDWKFYHGERRKALGGFNASGSAIPQLNALYDYAKAHPENLFIFKFHFDIKKDGGQRVNEFLETKVVNKLRDQLVKRSGDNLLGQNTMADTVHQGKNIAILAHHAGEQAFQNESTKDYIWPYGTNTYGGWGKTPDSDQLTAHLTRNIQRENDGRVLVSQTNLPAAIPPSAAVLKNPAAWKGLKHLASRSHEAVAEGVAAAVENSGHNPGVMSMDFAGTSNASTQSYRQIRDTHNRKFQKYN